MTGQNYEQGIGEQVPEQEVADQLQNITDENVANVKFSIKPMTSEYVAKYAVDKTLEGKELIIPGTRNKILHAISKLTPSRISSKVVYKNQTRKI